DIKKKTCYNCFIACKREDKKRGIELPEYETIAMFGPNSMNDDIEKIIQANLICNDYGVDTISAGSTVSCYLELEGGNDIETPLKEIVEGGPLSEGSLRYSKSKGKEGSSMSVKGLEIPGYDPRGVLGLALSYATSNRGACHLRAYMVAPEILGKPKLIDRLSFSGKSGLIQIFQNISAGIHSLVMCQFSSFALSEEEYSNLLSAAVGEKYTSEEFIRMGERIYNLERLFNIREDISYSQDTLPDRFFNDDGILKEEFDSVLNEYYVYRGWNKGIPTKEKLDSLGLKKEAKLLVERNS
ncbi:MAG TPA: aldehyde ferredoxin oxidoreductase C-terminal domain-containing protein, partial [Methanofastidiosum sp.]|nr:aldehyde ferredoxin oxidoreductase C-terminal domain-containing protein [Methanofastidiosum sp.]